MGIKGVSDKGLDFPEIGRIKKGEMQEKTGRNGKYTAPVDLDYFKIVFSKGFEHLDSVFKAAYPDKEPKAINIFLPFNDIVEMWDPFLEAYTASRLLARSDGPADKDGMVLFRCDPKTGDALVKNGINLETGLPEPHPEDNIAGLDYKGKPVEYSPVGRLKVIVPELEEAGYMMMITGSWNDCENISKQLRGIKELNNGVIKGVPLQMIRSDQEVMAPIDGKKKRVTKSLISIIANSDWVSARIAEDRKLSFPVQAAVALLEPSYDLPEGMSELELAYSVDDGQIDRSELTPPDEWGKEEDIQGEIVDEKPLEAPETAPQPESTLPNRPYSAEMVKVQVAGGILKYAQLLEKDPGKYQVQLEQDGKILASVIDGHFANSNLGTKARYAISEYLIGKGSTKTWTAYEVGAIKNLWLGVNAYGEILGDVQSQELMNVWHAVQIEQGQEILF